MMKIQKIFFSFAGFVCEIRAPEKQIEYIVKCYEKSPFSSFLKKSLKDEGLVCATLQINIVQSNKNIDIFELISDNSLDFKLNCTDNLFFIFPVIEQVLRKIYYILFFKNKGFVLHASGVTNKNNASIFIGKSGSGKSTIMNILVKNNKFTSFADNNVFIIFDDQKNKFFIYKSPFLEWNVSYKNNVKDDDLKVEINKLFTLKKSKENIIKKISFNVAISTIIQQIQIPSSNLSSDEISKSRKIIFIFLSQFFNSMSELSFKKDESIADYLLEIMS